jgi:Domain of unknown function (DUF397)
VDLSRADWRKSTYSTANGCVEVAFVESRVAVRDSKWADSPVLLFSGAAWEEFVGVRDREFDLER